jgi:hypothetical protein
MSNQFTMGTGGLPAGSYPVRFVRCEEYNEHKDLYGPAVRLVFAVQGGDHDGEEGFAVCSAKLTPKSKLSKFATGLKGAPIATGETFDFDDHSGTEGLIVVEPTDSGGGKVVSFIRSH